MTKGLLKRFKEVGNQEGADDPLVIAKYFNPTGSGDWFATEYEPKDRIFFGYVSLTNEAGFNEWGNFSLDELAEFKGFGGLGIERDLHFKEQPISTAKAIKGII